MCRVPRRDNFIFTLSRALACLLLVSGVGLVVQPYAALGTQAPQSNPNQPPAYKPLRYEEDYSYLKDPDRRTDFWDTLKYIPLGSLLRTGQVSRERYVGSTPALTVTWTLTRNITVVASYVHFFAGPFFEETPPGKDIDYFTSWINLQILTRWSFRPGCSRTQTRPSGS